MTSLLNFDQHIIERKTVFRLVREKRRRSVLESLRRFVPKTVFFLHNPTLHRVGCGVKPENAKSLMAEPEIDGLLVGGASLDPVRFAAIVNP